MKASLAISAALALFALSLAGCSPESKAQDTLDKYGELGFKICKEETEKMKMKPGEHRCALITSMALDMSLKDTGLDPAKADKMRDEWLEKSGWKPYYIPKAQRAPEHQ